MRRFNVVLTGMITVFALTSATAQAEPEKVSPQEVRMSKTVAVKLPAKSLENLSITNTRTKEAVPLDTPPLGGCDIDSEAVFHFTVNWWYLNGVLTNSETSGFAAIQCFPTGPGQLMGALRIDSGLWINSTHRNGEERFCSNCNLQSATPTDICAGQTNCAGGYWMSAIDDLVLPPGWVWTGTPGPGCTIYDALLQCVVVSEVITVPPTN